MAKDVVTFLSWAAEPEHDERKKYGIKAVIIFSVLTAISLYVKRFKWAPIKARKIRTLLLFLTSNCMLNANSEQCTTRRTPSTEVEESTGLEDEARCGRPTGRLARYYLLKLPCNFLLRAHPLGSHRQNIEGLRIPAG